MELHHHPYHSQTAFCFWLNSELISRLVSHSQTARNGIKLIVYLLNVGGSSKQIDHGKYFNGGFGTIRGPLHTAHMSNEVW